MSKRGEAAWVVLGFTCLAIAGTYPLVLALGSRLPSDLGDPLLTTWTLAWDAQRLRRPFSGHGGLWGLWDAPSFFPYRHTLLYSDHLLGIAVFTSPIQWLTGNAVLVYNLAFLASFALSGAGMYLLARALTGRRDAALVAALVYACQPFRISHMAHLQWLMTGWLPLGLWALHRYFVSGAWRHLLLSTMAFLVQALTAVYFTYFALLPILVVGIAEWRRARPPTGRLALHLAGAAILAAAVTLPVARGYYQVRELNGLTRTAEDVADHSADVGDYFSAPPRLRLWKHLGRGRGEHELFPGFAALLLAAIAVLWQRDAAVLTYATLAAIAFVLSLGAAPAAWGHSLGRWGPYGWLLAVVPGLDGLRAPARLAVIVQLGLAALSAFGASHLIDRLSGVRRYGGGIAVALLSVTIVAEGWAAPIPTLAFDRRGDPRDHDAYAYVRSLPAGAVLELPTSVERVDDEFRYQYMTLIHGHPAVNGQSGYVTPLLEFLGGGHSPFHEAEELPAALEMVRGIGVRYLVVHAAAFDDGAAAEALLSAVQPQALTIRQFGDTTVAVLSPLDALALAAPPHDVRRVPRSAIRASASQVTDRLPMLFDGDLDSRWVSGGHQAGDEWIELALDHQRDVRVVRLQMATRSFGDYPRILAVDVVEDGAARTVFRGSVLPQFARGLVVDGIHPSIDVVLPANRATIVRLRQLGVTHLFFWSIHELQLLERL
jgi:hypothetical protein